MEDKSTRRKAFTQRVAVAALKRLQGDFGTIQADLFNIDGFGFKQTGLHAYFLSIPPARYTGKAGEVPIRNAFQTGTKISNLKLNQQTFSIAGLA